MSLLWERTETTSQLELFGRVCLIAEQTEEGVVLSFGGMQLPPKQISLEEAEAFGIKWIQTTFQLMLQELSEL